MAKTQRGAVGWLRRGTLLGQLSRFVVSGGIVAVFMMTTVSGLVLLTGLDDQMALALAYVGGIALNFTLNRQFVFSGRRYAFGLTGQGVRYLVAALASYAITAVAMAFLPSALGLSSLAVYFIAAITVGLATFIVLRIWVFREPEGTSVIPSAPTPAQLAQDGRP